MLKKLLMLFVALSLSLTAAFAAAVEVNTADQAALESVKGLGPVKSKAIIDERTKNGPFKNADDLANRVKGLGAKSVAHLEENGLTIGGSSTPPKGEKASKPGVTTNPMNTTTGTKTTGAAPAATPAPTPAASAPEAAEKPAKAKRASKKDKAASAAAAPEPAPGASAPAAASPAKATKESKKKSKKDKAASAAAASGA